MFVQLQKAITGAAALVLACGLSCTGAQAAETITIPNFGGAFEAAANKAWFEPFTAATGIQISKEEYSGGLAKLREMVTAKDTIWDVIDLESNDAILGCDEGLLEKLGPSVIKDRGDFIPGAILPCAVSSMVWSTVYAYDTTKLTPAPTTIADFFDLQRFPGKRGVRKSPKVIMEWALMADGVPAKDVYKVLGTPVGLDRAFKKLDTIRSSIVWWEAGAQPPQLLADGAVVMTMAYNGRIYDAQHKEAKPFKIVWDGQIYDFEYWGIATGTKHKAASEKFVAFATDPSRIGDLSRYIAYAPPSRSAIAKIEPANLPNLPTAPANFQNGLQLDPTFWADNLDVINKRFQSWIAE
jgi:putative spermidine/putrescine transport system substrate-binding protein